ncbi:uncharacterized protein LOC120281183 [Dioscorea cayenensis subsp. rotundata]|uniref:Uncharacterized protein LOC120281183 n=1 Tax=Dioscorea cayennensis subsp. rotundata TaxID=55577 RepID=A0AB40CVL4_DIOCR|nr:uncharacterized protein LOC120281183 [Dioscorea cayenensis subsp. rotundata]
MVYDPDDATGEYIKISESTAIKSLKRFCRAIVEIFIELYLRSPNANDIVRLFHIREQCSFLVMLGNWTVCIGSGKIVPQHMMGNIEEGTNNDINVLESSNLLSNLVQGITPPAHYIIQGNEHHMKYYFADNIYPKWSTIVQTMHQPRTPKKKYFAMRQETCRKDIERAFGVLQSRFAIVAGPIRF